MESFQIARITGALLGLGVLAGCGAGTASTPLPLNPKAQVSDAAEKVKAKNGDLIYVMGPTKTYIVSYTDGSIVGSFDKTNPPSGLCSDKHGNVFMPDYADIWKYKHGGTTPIDHLKDDGYVPLGCSVDPTTGNLALANFGTPGTSQGAGNIAIYSGAAGTPTFYDDASITRYYSCAYDESGNLFINGGNASTPFILAELPKGSSSFQRFNLNQPAMSGGAVQWDGEDLAVGVQGARLIYRIKVTGSMATVVSKMRLDTLGVANPTFWVRGGYVVTASGATRRKIGFWKYARGGKPVKQYGPISPKPRLGGLTVSVSPRQ